MEKTERIGQIECAGGSTALNGWARKVSLRRWHLSEGVKEMRSLAMQRSRKERWSRGNTQHKGCAVRNSKDSMARVERVSGLGMCVYV